MVMLEFIKWVIVSPAIDHYTNLIPNLPWIYLRFNKNILRNICLIMYSQLRELWHHVMLELVRFLLIYIYKCRKYICEIPVLASMWQFKCICTYISNHAHILIHLILYSAHTADLSLKRGQAVVSALTHWATDILQSSWTGPCHLLPFREPV